MIIKCLIVEDEPLAAEIVSDFITQVPFLELVGICNDAFAAMQVLKEESIDLMFLDIHLPKLKGLDFLNALKTPPLVVITTAYHEFALKSYDYDVLDYLLKPIDFSRFMIAINKAIAQQSLKNNMIPDSGVIDKTDLFFTVNKKKARIAIDSILYIESQRENIKIVTDNKTVVTRYAISDIEKELPSANFIRVHRSFIVAKDKIDFIDSQDVEIRNKEIPIGRSYRDLVKAVLGM